jgi:hypothetical protein
MSRNLEQVLEKVKTREWWPVRTLADVLGKPKSYIYRRIENEDFCVLNDGSFIKIQTASVIKYFSERHL